MGEVRQLGARGFIAAMTLAACLSLAVAFHQDASSDPVKFTCYLVVALLASPLKVSLPGIEGTLSVNYLFTLLGILELSLPQTLLIGLGSTLVQSYWKALRKPRPVQLLFNLSQVTVSSAAAYGAYHLVATHVLHAPGPLALLAAAVTHFGCNTLAMSTIIGLTEEKPIVKLWTGSYLWSCPYYLVGAAAAGLVSLLNHRIGWQSSLLVLPPMYLMYRSYRLYLGKLEDEKRYAERVSNLHLRTIEALALAIGAKDHTTGEHLQRVRVYAMEVAKELGLSEDEKEALRAAAVLHDIGKLAVPESIIAKPGKLTAEEFEKMKIHPVVGAEILEQVDFPYPVSPIVRAHHEKWDGGGYPDGLKGEDIPIGARILAAVDCLDALASDRQYRKALPLEEAMASVAAESGTSFDPRVIGVLERRYVELEKMAKEQPVTNPPKLSTDIKIERGAAPAAGFAEEETLGMEEAAAGTPSEIRSEARREESDLFDIWVAAGAALRGEDAVALLAARLQRMVPHETLVLYGVRHGFLLPQWVSGEHPRRFLGLKIPLGSGLCGWVAANGKPIVNGNPAVEPGFSADGDADTPPGFALALPVDGASGVIAVLALYRAAQDSFTSQELERAEIMVARLGMALEAASGRSKAASAGW